MRLRFWRSMRDTSLIWFMDAVHLLWAVTILIDPRAGAITRLGGLVQLLGSVHATAAALLIGVCLATIGLCRLSWHPLWRVAVLIPQQTILYISTGDAVRMIVAGHYADGAVRPRLFILADQGGLILIAMLYTINLLMIGRRWT